VTVWRKIESEFRQLIVRQRKSRVVLQTVLVRRRRADREIWRKFVPALVEAGDPNQSLGTRRRLDPEIRRLLNGPNEVNGWAALEALGCPGTIIRGAFSSVLDAATAQKMVQRLRKPAGNLTVPKSGHAIVFEQPHALAHAIAKGLRSA